MKAAFRLTLALIATAVTTLGASGCRTAGLSPSARPRPAVVPEPRTSFRLDDFIDDHNRNAGRIESLISKASITGAMESPDTGEVATYATSGRVSMLRPKDFKLELYGRMQTVADIGSNKDRFWFWIDASQAEKVDRHVYYCDYQDLPSANLAGTYQPDWIVDALGLKPITDDEAATIRVAPGPKEKTTKLTFPASGEPSSYTRIMIVSDVSRRVVKYQVLDRDGKTLIGEADIKLYKDLPLADEAAARSEPETDSESGSDPGSTEPKTCHVPESLELKWMREKLSLEILLKDVEINPPFSARMKANFVEPKRRGYSPVNLAEATRNDPQFQTQHQNPNQTQTQGQPRSADEMTAVRETLSAPEPEPGRDRARSRPKSRPSSSSRAGDEAPAAALAPILLPVHDDVVGAVRPQAPGSTYQVNDPAQYLGGGTFAR